ncbi:MAG: DNA-binding transcriptional LysR family regulator [Bermanella sp.]
MIVFMLNYHYLLLCGFAVNLSKVDLNLFIVFDVIFAQQSLTRAAEVLHVTQPAVSNSLSRLREIFSDPLFVRSRRGMSPTPLARQLIDPVRASLKSFDDCIRTRLDFDPLNATQTFRIHATEQAEINLLPVLLQHLAKAAPGVRLEMMFMNRRDVPLALASGELQLSLDAPLLNHPELMSMPLSRDDYVCALREEHPLRRKKLSLKQYLAAAHVNVSSRVKGSGHIDLALRSIGKKRDISLRLQHYSSLPGLLASSDLLASIPKTLAHYWKFAHKPLPFETNSMELHAFWHRSADHDPSTVWLRTTVAHLLQVAPPKNQAHSRLKSAK